jgi:hypothetical protein
MLEYRIVRERPQWESCSADLTSDAKGSSGTVFIGWSNSAAAKPDKGDVSALGSLPPSDGFCRMSGVLC